MTHTVYPDLAGKSVLVTGGSKGIGRAIAAAFAVNQASVSIVARSDRAAFDGVVQELGVGGYMADLTEGGEAQRVVDAIVAEHGRLDVLVNNVGGFDARKSMLEIGDDEWQAIIDRNLTTAFNACRAAVPAMIEQGGGAIVSIGSEAGRNPPWPTGAHYAASKAALAAMMRELARECGPHGIRVNLLVPGGTVTDRYARLGLLTDERRRRTEHEVPLARLSQPDEQAAAVLFLASGAASYITGQALTVNGGKSMSE